MASAGDEINVCVKCGNQSKKGDSLNLVGSVKGNREGQRNKHPLDKLIEQSRSLNLETLVRTL